MLAGVETDGGGVRQLLESKKNDGILDASNDAKGSARRGVYFSLLLHEPKDETAKSG